MSEANQQEAPQFIDVPAGTPSSECPNCKHTVYWITTVAGQRIPVNCDVMGGLRPVRFGAAAAKDNGRGTSHYLCYQAGSLRRKG